VAVSTADDVDYGLVSGIFTIDIGRAHRVARAKGLAALEEYTQIKNVCARIE
jgi:acyl-CoA reductase-like NAD-dependent aldehyde dehydrogenase